MTNLQFYSLNQIADEISYEDFIIEYIIFDDYEDQMSTNLTKILIPKKSTVEFNN